MALRTVPKLLLVIPAAAGFYLFVVWLLSRKLGTLERNYGPEKCSWTGEDALRRAQFCKSEHLSELFRNVCACKNPMAITYENPVEPLEGLVNTPILIIAADRPKYLLRCIYHLLLAYGVNKENIVVSIDGSYSETEAVATLFGIRSFQSKSEGTKSARVSRHYRRALEHVMNVLYPEAPNIIILEDDLQVAPDFFYYFEHLMPMFENDDDLYCISAWNDHGMEHAVFSPENIYRIEGMPGLGWATSRKIINELLPKWLPKERFTDWDIWMRQPAQRRGRQCLVPDISRTFHFGEDGLNVNSKMQGLYFRNHAIFKEAEKIGRIEYTPLANLSVDKNEEILRAMIESSEVLPPAELKCAPGAKKVPYFERLSKSNRSASFKIYFKQDSKNDLDDYLRLCWCLNIWDLDSRANYKGVTRIHLQDHPIFLVGHPNSEFSHDAKPNEVIAINQEIPAGNRRYKH